MVVSTLEKLLRQQSQKVETTAIQDSIFNLFELLFQTFQKVVKTTKSTDKKNSYTR